MRQQKRIKTRYCTALAFIAMVLSFLSQITPLWAQQSDGTPILICSAFGTKTVFIDENGNKVPDAPEYKKSHCTMCLNASISSLSGNADIYDIVPIPQTAKLSREYEKNIHLKSPLIQNINGIRAPPALI